MTEQEAPRQFTIRNHVKKLRRRRGLSHKDLADAVGINHRTVGYIERHDYTPSLELAYTIADLFGVGPYDVFYRSTDENGSVDGDRREPPPAVQELAGGKARSRLLVALLDYSPADEPQLRKITGVPSGKLAEHLTALQEMGLVQTEDQPGPFLGKPARAVFGLSERGRGTLAEAFRLPDSAEEER